METIEDLKSEPFPSQSGVEGFIASELAIIELYMRLIRKQAKEGCITFVKEALHIEIFEPIQSYTKIRRLAPERIYAHSDGGAWLAKQSLLTVSCMQLPDGTGPLEVTSATSGAILTDSILFRDSHVVDNQSESINEGL